MAGNDPSRWWAGEGRYLKASKQGMFKIVPDGTEMSFMSASVESVMPKKLLPTSNPSVAFSLKNVGDETTNDDCVFGVLPAIAKFKTIGDK